MSNIKNGIPSNEKEMRKYAEEFLKLLKDEKCKDTESYIEKLSLLPRIGPRVTQVLRMKLIDGLTYKNIGITMGFSVTRSRQLYCKGIDVIENASNKKD